MRRDRPYLDDIIEAVEAIDKFLLDVTEEQFLASDLLQSAVLQKLTIIGEAAARLSPRVKADAMHIPWSDIAAFRNIAVHAYFSVQWPIVWVAATEEAALLKAQVLALLSADVPASTTYHGSKDILYSRGWWYWLYRIGLQRCPSQDHDAYLSHLCCTSNRHLCSNSRVLLPKPLPITFTRVQTFRTRISRLARYALISPIVCVP